MNPDSRAERHRPTSPEEIARAARELTGRGYSVHTVAAILRLDVTAVRVMLGEPNAAAVSA